MVAQLCEVLVWVLVHSLWQGILIAGCVSMLLRWLPARRAESRYASCVAGLGLIVLSAMVTWSVLTLDSTGGDASKLTAVRQTTSSSATAAPAAVIDGNFNGNSASEFQPDTISSQPLPASHPSFALRDWMPWIAGLWMTGACLMLVRTIGAIVTVRRWRTLRVPTSPACLEQLQAIQRELCEGLHLNRHVTLWLSEQVAVPAVIGTLWPCILIPPTLVASIPLDQWRVILAHELAHIRRYDSLVNLVQMMVESLLFFNPAVWWVSRQIRVEREACCDTLAARVCGQPLSVARTLVEFAAGLNGDARWSASSSEQPSAMSPAMHSTALTAFADPAEPGELTDRVQRLVEPDTAAHPRVSWTGLCVVLCSLLVTALALQWGTAIAVQTAAQLISPRERIAKLERLQSEATGVFLPPEPQLKQDGDATADKKPATDKKPGEIAVTVVVRTADGAPIPKGLQLNSLWHSGNHSNSSSLDVTNEEVKEYRKTFPFPPCRLRLGAFVDGYASVSTPILSLFPEESARTIELVLTKGTIIKLRIRDFQDRPVAGAEMRLAALLSIAGSTSSLGQETLQADADGVVALDHMGDSPHSVQIRAPGFQRYEGKFEFKPSETVRLELKPATPVSVRVVDAETEQPIAKASVVVASIQRNDSNHSILRDPRPAMLNDSWYIYGQTDDQGRAVLNELIDGSRYTFGVLADGYGMKVVENVHAGQQVVTVKLVPPLTLAGRIEGDLTQLQLTSRNGKEKPQRTLGYSHRVNDQIQDYSHATVDAEGRFTIGNLIAGERVSLGPPVEDQDIVMTKSITDLTLKIAKPNEPTPFPKRDVIIRLTGTAPNAPARGTLYVSWSHPDSAARLGNYKDGAMPLRGNEIHFSVPVGASLYYRPDNLVGYKIEERNQIVIAAGSEPHVIEVPTRPAGGIHGTIVRADGTPATSGFITVFATKLPPGEKDLSKINPSTASASSTFLASLPLGGRYRVLVREFSEVHNVWTLSDEITLDESQPIAEVRLQLPRGRDIAVRVLAPDGTPVANQLVAVGLGFSQPKGHSTSMSVNRFTGADGVAHFEGMSVDASITPLEFSLDAEVATSKFIGWRKQIDPKRPIEIRLESGLSASGVLIDATSGKPIPNADVRLMPRDFGTAKYRGMPRTKSGANGEFRFEGLEDKEYVGYVDGSVPKGTQITRQPDGNIKFEYQSGVEQHRLEPGSDVPARWEVIIYPGSNLKTTE